MKFGKILGILFMFSCLFFCASFSPTAEAKDAKWIDVHTHLVPTDVPQGISGPRDGKTQGQNRRMDRSETSGYRRQPGMQRKNSAREDLDQEDTDSEEGYLKAAASLIRTMERLGVDRSIVMPPPHASTKKDEFSYKVLLPAVEKYPDHLILGGGGVLLNTMIHGIPADRVTEKIKKRFRENAAEIVDAGAKVFGEMAVLHVSYSNTHAFEETSADHPLFLELADLSARYGVPIDIHMDCVVQDMPTPDFFAQSSSKNPGTLKANVSGFEKLLRHNRHAKIVWQHVGRDTLGQQSVSLLRRLLADHSNLYYAIWARPTKMDAVDLPAGPNQILDENYEIKDEWLDLFQEYPDRFVVGTDGFFSAKTRHMSSAVDSTWTFLDKLPQDLRDKIGGENAVRIYDL